jgi:catechol 2,3-dioxygenase-like lactoylglutathione lyase family enzyme
MLQDSPSYAYIPAKDLARARRFYEDTLGFRPKEEVGSPATAGGAKAAWFKDTEGNILAIIESEYPPGTRP